MQKRISLLTSLAVLMATTIAPAYPLQLTAIPEAFNRANAWIKDHPNRAEGYFFLGGVEGSAWAKGTAGKGTEVEITGSGDSNNPPRLVPWTSIMFQRDAALAITPEAIKSLNASIAAYRNAVELDPRNPLYHLGLAWSLEEAARANLHRADIGGDAPRALTDDERLQCEAAIALLENADAAQREQGTKTLSALMPRDAATLRAFKSDDAEVAARIEYILQGSWLIQAVEHYRKAYQQSVEHDLKTADYDIEADNAISVKAGERLLSLLSTQSGATPNEIRRIKESLQAIKAKPVMRAPRL